MQNVTCDIYLKTIARKLRNIALTFQIHRNLAICIITTTIWSFVDIQYTTCYSLCHTQYFVLYNKKSDW